MAQSSSPASALTRPALAASAGATAKAKATLCARFLARHVLAALGEVPASTAETIDLDVRRAEDESVAGAWAVQLCELGLRPGDCFAYHFDFGDHHRFALEVVAVEPQAAGSAKMAPEVFRSVGKAPAQCRW